MTNEKKYTKKEILETLALIVRVSSNSNDWENIDTDSLPDTLELLSFLNKEIEALDEKARKAKEAREKKANEVDELAEKVFACLTTTDFTTIPEIVKKLDDETVTAAKVTSRLSKMVKMEKVEKDLVKVGDRKITGYRVIE